MNDYKEIVAQLRGFLEAALEEGRNCGYDKPYDPKDKDQSQFDRGQFNAYRKTYKVLLKCLDEDDDPDDDDDDDDDDDSLGCSIAEFLKQIIDLANDDK